MGWALLVLISVIGGVAWFQYRAGRSTYRPLARRQPDLAADQPELGTEAIDMTAFNAATRRNEALEPSRARWVQQRPAHEPPQNSSYATWFHTTFQKKRQTKDDPQ